MANRDLEPVVLEPNALVEDWKAELSAASSQKELDAVEFLECAAAKFALYEQKGRTVRSIDELRERIRQDENAELLAVISVSAEWYCGGRVAGFCQFRRTWCNNVVFDFLSVRPELLVPATRHVSGLGTALLYRLALVANDLNAGIVWAETTDTSAHFYAHLFGHSPVSDLVVVKSSDFYASLASAVELFQKGR